jgi:hypothetical protein
VEYGHNPHLEARALCVRFPPQREIAPPQRLRPGAVTGHGLYARGAVSEAVSERAR